MGSPSGLITTVVTTLFFLCFSLSADLKMLCLLIFCAEGDNVGDALTLSTFANGLLKIVPSNQQVLHIKCDLLTVALVDGLLYCTDALNE